MKKIGFLTIITAALFFSACNPDTLSVNDDDQNIPTEAGFSVSPDKRVDFAKGNLLFHRYPGTLLVDSVYIKTTGSGKNKKYYVDEAMQKKITAKLMLPIKQAAITVTTAVITTTYLPFRE